MYLRTVLILIVLGAVALFTVVNWQAVTAPTSLSLIVGTVEAPLGLILLGLILLLLVLFVVYVAYLQSSVLLESRRHARELQAQRDLAEHAESSRLRELRSFVESQLQSLTRQLEETKTETTARLDQLNQDLRAAIAQSETSLTAYLGEIDDRLERSAADAPAKKPELP
jgi:uncharacterized membrane protein YgaE (UPF0421/DUF939 family)